jgi:hypothetical protein
MAARITPSGEAVENAVAEHAGPSSIVQLMERCSNIQAAQPEISALL